jgi:hypothetical protein
MDTYYIPEEATLPIPVTIDFDRIPSRSAIERWSIRRLVSYVDLTPTELLELSNWRTGNNVLTDVLPNLESVILLNQSTPYPDGLMMNKSWLREWEDANVPMLPKECFRNSGLSYAYFGAIGAVGNYCFYQTARLTDLRIAWIGGTTMNAGERAFGYSGINNFGTSSYSPTEIGVGAFEACYHLKSINLMQTQNIPDDAFRLCRNMTVLHLSAATLLGNAAFMQNYCLRSLTVGNNCSASAGTFAGADTILIDLFIPDGSVNGNPDNINNIWYGLPFKSVNFI